MNDHLPKIEGGKVVLSPLALLVMTMVLPFVKDFVTNQYNQRGAFAEVATKVENVGKQTDALQTQVNNAVTKEEFRSFEKSVEDMHTAEMSRLNSITDAIMQGKEVASPVNK